MAAKRRVASITQEASMETERTKAAVQYLRMSTEHQRYSLENQASVIADYALERGLHIVRTYTEAGKSGLTLRGRKGLQQLLSDALNPSRDFSNILVLDVSRWGRFQNTDQAAHYEYICHEAGAQVAYCGEMFENDGGMVSTIVKHLKRVMAGEYSRELSAKVTRAKLQQARLGFRQGGSVGYGFSRQLVQEDGTQARILKPGQQKALHTDRVRTVAGPLHEQDMIRRIFRLFVLQGGSFRKVATQLNAEGLTTNTGGPWRPKRIAYIIRNELCVGVATYNKTNRSMRSSLKPRPDGEWVRTRIGQPIVRRALFNQANRLAGGGRRRYSEADLLRGLKGLLKRKGYLSPAMIDQDAETACFMTYVARFGSVERAYELIGYAYPGRRVWQADVQGFWTEETILAAVLRIHQEHGYVSAALLQADAQAPSPHTVAQRFGGLKRCYVAAGLPSNAADALRLSNRLAQKRRFASAGA
jgi:DNA invertase Pin-like site-specific DNA recombinase